MHITYNLKNGTNATSPAKTTIEVSGICVCSLSALDTQMIQVPMGSQVNATGSCSVSVTNMTAEQRLSLYFNKTWGIQFMISSDKL